MSSSQRSIGAAFLDTSDSALQEYFPVLEHSVSTAARVRAVDIRRFSWIKPLAADYAVNAAGLREFFAGHPSEARAWRDAVGRAQAHPRRRAEVAAIVRAQQQRRGAPAAAVAAGAALADLRSVAIVTGQQPGLFGGPLYTLLKAITALKQADAVRSEHGVPAVAVFWVDAEDHDWNEVKACSVLDAGLERRSASLDRPASGGEGPVARVVLDAQVDQAIETLAAALPPTEFTPEVIDGLRRAYRPGTGMADAFARWLESILGPRGLVVYDSSDPAAKPILAALFEREVEGAGETSTLVRETGARLEARGYHAQVAPAENAVALFHLSDAGREPIRLEGQSFVVGSSVQSKADLREAIRRAPEAFSPNVVLRPLAQDTLFPTVCYVAGPSELAYLAQLRGVYERFDTPMPLVLQRATATVVDSNALRFLSKYDCPFEQLSVQDEALLNSLLESQLPAAIEASLLEAERAIDATMTRLAAEVPQIDATLEGTVRSTATRMHDDLKKLHGKIVQAAKRKDETLRRQFRHAQGLAFPGGAPQERAVAAVYFLDKYGPVLVDRLLEELPLEMGRHWIVAV